MAETKFIISSVNYPNKQKSLIHLIKINLISSIIESVVAHWLAHLPLVLEVSGLIPARNEENFGVQTCFPKCHLQIR